MRRTIYLKYIYIFVFTQEHEVTIMLNRNCGVKKVNLRFSLLRTYRNKIVRIMRLNISKEYILVLW